ncbi:KAP family P-loop domain-containing protein [Ruminococcaceae bacterium KH2T8]|nr:KAP family P-loop domain-containing protein [Ruminococcaceae bacterium KH2T8]
MNYNTDRAITKVEDDLLGRSSFSEALGKALYEYDAKDGLVIGLYGKWGTGKTSIANMALQTVTKYAKPEKAPIIVRFSPWNYSDKDNLISQFFHTLCVAVAGSDNTEVKKYVGSTLKEYAELFDALTLIPSVGIAAAAATKGIAKLLGNHLEKRGDLDTRKKNLEEALKQSNQKFIVIIDDIDRLTNSQILDIFQLVKQVADFPNVIYLLLMDREIVKNALTNVHDCDGNEYLGKIVQVPFEIPEIDKVRLNEIMRAKLVESIPEKPRGVTIDYAYWTVVFRNCVSPYVLTLRDMNRVLNTFCFKFDMMHSETSFEDMMGITTIEVLEPELYCWVTNHKNDLCVRKVDPWTSFNVKNDDYRSYYSEVFRKLGIDSQKAIRSLATLFPVFSDKVGYSIKSANDVSNIRSGMRVANEERFDLYFVLDVENVKVPRYTIKDCIFTLSPDELEKTILDISDQGNIVYFLEELESLIDTIPYDRLQVVASVLYGVKSLLKGGKNKASLSLSAIIIADDIARNIIKRLNTTDERYKFFLSRINDCSIEELGSISNDLRRMESAWGRTKAVSENKDEQIVSVEQLEELEKIFIERLKGIKPINKFIGIDDWYDLYCYWYQYDRESADVFFAELMKNEINKLKFFCRLAGHWIGNSGSGWSFINSPYRQYTSEEEFTNLILQVGVKHMNEFSETEQLKMATYILESANGEEENITEQEAMNLVKKWKKT